MTNYNDDAGDQPDEEVPDQESFDNNSERSTRFYEPASANRYNFGSKGVTKKYLDENDNKDGLGDVAGRYNDDDGDGDGEEDSSRLKKKVTISQILLLFSVLFVEIIVMLITFFPAELAMIYSGPFEPYLSAFVPRDEIEPKVVVVPARRKSKQVLVEAVSVTVTPTTIGMEALSGEKGASVSVSNGDEPTVVDSGVKDRKNDESLALSATPAIISSAPVVNSTIIAPPVQNNPPRKRFVTTRAKALSEKPSNQKGKYLEGRFFVQVAAVRRRSQAEDLVRSFRGKGLGLRMEETYSKGLTLYRVVSGPLLERDARELADKLVRDNLVRDKPFVRRAE